MAVQPLSQSQLNDLKAQVQRAFPAAQAGPALTGGEIKEDFCTIWPKAEPVLKALEGIPVAGPIIAALVAAGDAVAGAICPKTLG